MKNMSAEKYINAVHKILLDVIEEIKELIDAQSSADVSHNNDEITELLIYLKGVLEFHFNFEEKFNIFKTLLNNKQYQKQVQDIFNKHKDFLENLDQMIEYSTRTENQKVFQFAQLRKQYGQFEGNFKEHEIIENELIELIKKEIHL